ncbi:TIGR01777 family oxidoreductase [Virgibacillus kekensis]|uniref:TIGR01777 family oxidoreductase n=1 Tax=Virgibacillus kekensis TaxID=202261 RepID=A0ABV9DDH7_9BACI
MNILITGGTGFVGSHLTKELTAKDHHVYILTRSPDKHNDTERVSHIGYDDQEISNLPPIQGVVNLAGDSLFGYWTRKKKETLLSSRINTTQKLIDMIQKMDRKPDVFISGSAVGFYGTSEDLIYTERTTEPGKDFLAKVAVDWEKAASQAEQMGIRTIYTRFGVILGNEGALPYMKLPVKLFAGGKIGNGQQWLSWVHIYDVVQLIQFCLFNDHISGPVNVTAPHPKRNKDFTKILADALNRPYWLPTPAPLIRTIIGEMSMLITKGQFVLPKKVLDSNYQFTYPNLRAALEETERTKA